jgi:hypothetical protein
VLEAVRATRAAPRARESHGCRSEDGGGGTQASLSEAGTAEGGMKPCLALHLFLLALTGRFPVPPLLLGGLWAPGPVVDETIRFPADARYVSTGT